MTDARTHSQNASAPVKAAPLVRGILKDVPA